MLLAAVGDAKMFKYLSAGISRREFMTLAGAGSAAAIAGYGLGSARAEQTLETTRIRLAREVPACWAPQYVAESLLELEGFTDIQYLPKVGGKQLSHSLRSGEVDLALGFSGRQIKGIVPGDRSIFLSGLHTGCYSLIASKSTRSIRDLKGKTVYAGRELGDGPHVFFSTIVSYVGLDPVKDINYAWVSKSEAHKMFAEGELDAFLSFAPEPQELSSRGFGRVLVDTNVDRPWSQYFCCMVMGNRDFISKHPEATKRALRAILMGNDICAQRPERAADALIQRKIRKPREREFIIRAMQEIPYKKWRDFNPEDTIRYYTLRLNELKLTNVTPQDIIAKNTDWRFVEGLREELGMTW